MVKSFSTFDGAFELSRSPPAFNSNTFQFSPSKKAKSTGFVYMALVLNSVAKGSRFSLMLFCVTPLSSLFFPLPEATLFALKVEILPLKFPLCVSTSVIMI